MGVERYTTLSQRRMSRYSNPPNLLSYSFKLNSKGDVIVLAADTHRTSFSIKALTRLSETYMWIGPNLPPLDITQWLRLETDEFTFQFGVIGPIYIAEGAAKPAQIMVISPIREEFERLDISITEIAETGTLVDDLGDTLTTDSGDELIAFVL